MRGVSGPCRRHQGHARHGRLPGVPVVGAAPRQCRRAGTPLRGRLGWRLHRRGHQALAPPRHRTRTSRKLPRPPGVPLLGHGDGARHLRARGQPGQRLPPPRDAQRRGRVDRRADVGRRGAAVHSDDALRQHRGRRAHGRGIDAEQPRRDHRLQRGAVGHRVPRGRGRRRVRGGVRQARAVVGHDPAEVWVMMDGLVAVGALETHKQGRTCGAA
mmetsp:Transcript_29869/g.59147  ORF Transcript_29869/g.59147 Transcript_29869/m.59147 type:complete len:214 (-) Transcript_29869:161-802(-)